MASLAPELNDHERVLAIVHRRDDAQRLAELVGEHCLHLSARMCATHRSSVLSDVKRRLESGAVCQLVSTQLIEAGVDVDFPEVYRAFAGRLSSASSRQMQPEGEGTAASCLHSPNQTAAWNSTHCRGRSAHNVGHGTLDLKVPPRLRNTSDACIAAPSRIRAE